MTYAEKTSREIARKLNASPRDVMASILCRKGDRRGWVVEGMARLVKTMGTAEALKNLTEAERYFLCER